MEIRGDIINLVVLWFLWVTTSLYKPDLEIATIDSELLFQDNISILDQSSSILNGVKMLLYQTECQPNHEDARLYLKSNFGYFNKYKMYPYEQNQQIIIEYGTLQIQHFLNVYIYKTKQNSIELCFNKIFEFQIDNVEYLNHIQKIQANLLQNGTIILFDMICISTEAERNFTQYLRKTNLQVPLHFRLTNNNPLDIQSRYYQTYNCSNPLTYVIDSTYMLSITNQSMILTNYINKFIQLQSNQTEYVLLHKFSNSFEKVLHTILLNYSPLQILIVYETTHNGQTFQVGHIQTYDNQILQNTFEAFNFQIEEISSNSFSAKKWNYPYAIHQRSNLLYIFISVDLNYLINFQEQTTQVFSLLMYHLKNDKYYRVKECKFTQNGNYIINVWLDDKLQYHFSLHQVWLNQATYQKNKIDVYKITEIKRNLENKTFRAILPIETQDAMQIQIIFTSSEIHMVINPGLITKLQIFELNEIDPTKVPRINILDLLACFFVTLGITIAVIHFRLL